MAGGDSHGTEVVFGIVGPIGADRSQVFRMLEDCLKHYGYSSKRVRLSKGIEEALELDTSGIGEYERVSKLMQGGNRLRSESKNNGVLGLIAAATIKDEHDRIGWGHKDRRFAFVVDSIKHPYEVHALRQVYRGGFFLVALSVDRERRIRYLRDQKGMSENDALDLVKRDEGEPEGHGQSTRKAFHLADFFVHSSGDEDKLRNSLSRLVRLVFGHPYTPPTFNEYAMYVAFASAMRSGDLSRQVGAVIASNKMIMATGANEVPQYGGGQYWSEYDTKKKDVTETPGGRDFRRERDSNHEVKESILDEIVAALPDSDATTKELLRSTAFWGITEYGRAVHAEMEAILSCARSGHSTTGADLYTTTFPCHNCAKHLVAAGIRRVFYVEPYSKSRALDLHADAISEDRSDFDKKVVLRPFVGVGPRQYVNCFSLNLGTGPSLERKDDGTGKILPWDPSRAVPRGRMLDVYYRDLEADAAQLAAKLVSKVVGDDNES